MGRHRNQDVMVDQVKLFGEPAEALGVMMAKAAPKKWDRLELTAAAGISEEGDFFEIDFQVVTDNESRRVSIIETEISSTIEQWHTMLSSSKHEPWSGVRITVDKDLRFKSELSYQKFSKSDLSNINLIDKLEFNK